MDKKKQETTKSQHGIAAVKDPEKFVAEERQTLMKEIGQAAIFLPMPKSVDERRQSNSKAPRSLHNPTRLFSNASESHRAAGKDFDDSSDDSESHRAAGKDFDDSSDEETVKTKVFGSRVKVSKRRVVGYDLENQWQEFLAKENNFLDNEVLGRVNADLEKLATEFFSDGRSVTVNLENGGAFELNKDNVIAKIKSSQSWFKNIRNEVLGEWIKYKIIPQYRKKLNKYYKRAFTAHAFGIGLLYSQEVEELYHSDEGLKVKFFSNPVFENNLINLAQGAFKYAISKAVEKQCDIFFKTNKQTIVEEVLSRSYGLLNQACEEVVKALSSKKLTVGNLKQEISNIIELKFYNTTTNKNLSDVIEQEFLAVISNNRLCYIDESERKTLNITKDSPLKDLMMPFENIWWKKLDEDKWELLIGINDKSPLSNSLSKDDLKSIGFERKGSVVIVNDSNKKLTKDLKEKLSTQAIELCKKNVAKTYSDEKLTDPESDSKKLSQSAKFFSLNKYLESQTPKNLATTIFRKNLKSGLSLYLNRNSLSREKLPTLYAFESENYVQEFANERVVRRLITRVVRDQKDKFLGSKESVPKKIIELAYKVGKYNEGVKEKSIIQMAKGASDPSLSELTDITRTVGPSSYVEIFSTINSFSKKFRISNKRMISLVRNGPDQDLEDDLLEFSAVEVNNLKLFLLGFRRLFFGLESRRNPAQRVLSQMMFDILEDKKIEDWEPYLAGKSATHADKKMPMMRVGAVPIARQKNAKMSDFMPWHYTYSGNEEEKKEEEGATNPEKKNPINSLHEMVIKESRIYREWLNHKKISTKFTEEALLIACEEWYGVKMDSVIYGSDNEQEERSAAKIAIRKWTKKTIKDPSKELAYGDYVLLTKILERSDFKPTAEEFNQIGEAVQARLKHLRSKNSSPEYQEKIFLKNLAQKILFNFNLLDSEEGVVIKGAKTGGYGNLLNELIKKSEFYKATEEIFPFKMLDMQSEIDEISRHIYGASSRVSAPISNLQLLSKSSSRSGSISD